MAVDSLIARSLQYIWYPCAQMKDYEVFKPSEVVAAHGEFLELADGRKIIDAISSWWCKSLGHQHPRLKHALLQQLDKYEHILQPYTINPILVALSEKLAQLTTSLNKCFYASEGSSAVEIALKMSLHAQQHAGAPQRTLFAALAGGYHGETIGAMSVSDLGLYRAAYEPLLFKTVFLSPLPWVDSSAHPVWHDCEAHWQHLLPQLEAHAAQLAAIIVEPIVQGANGMQIYSQDLLTRLRAWTAARGIYFIADEVMTGLGRTGKMLACEYAEIEPDFLCLGKGLTAGYLPMSVVLTRQNIYDLFYADYAAGKAFMHSHTFAGNALAASVALETLTILAEEEICARALQVGAIMHENLQNIAELSKRLTNVRGIGGIVAADLRAPLARRVGFQLYQHATAMGALVRPLGNTLYWLPPLNIHVDSLTSLKEITYAALMQIDAENFL